MFEYLDVWMFEYLDVWMFVPVDSRPKSPLPLITWSHIQQYVPHLKFFGVSQHLPKDFNIVKNEYIWNKTELFQSCITMLGLDCRPCVSKTLDKAWTTFSINWSLQILKVKIK